MRGRERSLAWGRDGRQAATEVRSHLQARYNSWGCRRGKLRVLARATRGPPPVLALLGVKAEGAACTANLL